MSSAITRCLCSRPSVLSLPRSAPSSHEHHWHPVAVLLQLPAPEVQPHCHHQTRALLWICARQNLSLAVNLTIPLLHLLNSVSLLGKPADSSVMSVATGKNFDAIPRKVGSHIPFISGVCCWSASFRFWSAQKHIVPPLRHVVIL